MIGRTILIGQEGNRNIGYRGKDGHPWHTITNARKQSLKWNKQTNKQTTQNSEYSENVFQIWRQGKLSEKQNLRNIAASRLAWQEVLKDVLKEHGSDGNRFLRRYEEC